MSFTRFSHRPTRAGTRQPGGGAAAVTAMLTLVGALLVVAPSAARATPRQDPVETESAMRTDTERPALTTAPASDAAPPVGDDAESLPVGARRSGGADDVDPFVLIGVGFRSASGGSGQVRVGTDGQWGAWTAIEFSSDHAADPGTTEAAAPGPAELTGSPVSEPLWVDHADAYQLDLPADATGVEVFLVRETDEPLELTNASESMTGEAGTASAAEANAGEPSVHLRSSWGARAYRGTPDISPPLRRAIVHHTVNTNSYSPAQVPALLRSIQAYHQDAKGWDDIGYNFVIDRYGGIWEARAGGIRNPVIGAHAMNHNTGSVGVSFLGDATSSVTSAAVSSYGQLIGWKLFLGGVRPATGNIMGHRDVGQTSCPGQALYNSLGQIRSLARAKYDDLVGTGAFASRSVTVSGTYTPLSGDFNGDAYGDVLWYGPGAAADRLWLGGPNGFTGRSVNINSTYRPATGDFNGDGRSDVFWYRPGGGADSVWFGQTAGGFTSKTFVVDGDYQPLAGDWNGDGKFDILWYGAGNAGDSLWYGTSDETFTGKPVTVSGTFTPFAGDFNGDQRSDVFWYGPGSAADSLWFGEPGGFSGRSITITGNYAPLVGDYTGGGTDDIFWYGSGAASDSLYLGNTNRTFTPRSVSVGSVFDAPTTGDWNADGRGDIFWYATAGADKLWLGTG